MKYIGLFIKWITFPGAFLHAFWEHLICRMYGVPVENNRYMQGAEMSGHVEHDFFPTPTQQFEFCFFPALFNTVLGLLIGIPAAIQLFIVGTEKWAALFIIMLWLGISLLTNINPLIEDAMFMWEGMYKSDEKPNIVVRILAFPFAALLYLGSYLNTYGLSLITSALTILGLPLIVSLFV